MQKPYFGQMAFVWRKGVEKKMQQEITYTDTITMGEKKVVHYRTRRGGAGIGVEFGMSKHFKKVQFTFSDGREQEIVVNDKMYYRWIKGLKANATFLYKKDADGKEHYSIQTFEVIFEDGITQQVIQDYVENERKRLHQYVSGEDEQEKGFFARIFAAPKSTMNALMITNLVETPSGADVYMSTVRGYNEPVGYPYFKFSTSMPHLYEPNLIVKLDMRKVTELYLNTDVPDAWYYDISYLNDNDFLKLSQLVNLVTQYL